MATPSARFVIGFDADTSGISQSKASLDGLKAAIAKDTAALKEMSDAMQRLKGTAEVVRWEALPKDISRAENEVAKLAAKMAKLKSDFAAAPADKRQGIFAQSLQTGTDLEKATGRLSALRGERDKLSKTEPVKLFEDLKAGAAKLKEGLGQSQTAFSRLGGVMGEGAGEAGKAAAGLKDLASGAEAAGLPTAGLVGKLGNLKALGAAGLIGAIVVAVVALTVALAAAVVKATAFVITMSDAARSARLLREASAGSAEAADQLYAATVRVEDKTNAQRETIAELAGEYARLKFSMAGVEAATSAVTIATQTLGAQAGSVVKGLIDRGVAMKKFWIQSPLDLKGTGITLKQLATSLAKQMKIGVGAAEQALRNGQIKLEDGVKALATAIEDSPLGEIARKQALALTTQFERAGKNIARLFSGVNVDPFLEKLAGPLDLLKEGNEVADALKHALTALFQPLVDSAGDSMPVLEGLIYGVTIAIQELVIGALDAAIWLKETFANSELLKGVDAFGVGMTIAEYALKGVLIIAGALALALAALGAALAAMVAIGTTTWGLIIDAFKGVVSAIQFIATEGPAAALSAAGDIILGLVQGILDGIPKVAQAFVDLAKEGLSSFKSFLGIKSPSKAFKAEAKWIGPGVAEGVDAGRPAVARSLTRLADPADLNVAGMISNVSDQSSAEDRSVHLTVNYYGRGSRKEAQELGGWLINVLETQNLAKGLPA